MSGFIQGEDRFQATLSPERLGDYVAEDSACRVIDVFIGELDLSGMGESVSSRLFPGWFGPRGLASIVFAVIVMAAKLPGLRVNWNPY